QGVGESMTFLIPDLYGGGTQQTPKSDSNVAKELISRGGSAQQAASQFFSMYWGDKPMTSGPWYFGACVLFLFVLGLFVVKSRIKWWICSATALIVLLSWGRHFTWVSDIFFNYFPLYNKFRAVESTLVVASFLIPILAVLAVQEIIQRGKQIAQLDKKIIYSLAIVGGISLIVWLLPDLFF